MPPEESSYPDDWLRIARRDLRRAQNLLSMNDPEAAGFYLQQAIEKFLKAYLLFSGWRLKRIHDLEILLDDALGFDPGLEEFRTLCIQVAGYYMAERYPFVLQPGVEEEDVRQSLAEADKLIGRLEAQMT